MERARGSINADRRIVLFCVLLFTGSMLVGCAAQVKQAVLLEGRLPISVAAVATAGTKISVMVGPVVAPAGTPVTLVVTGSYGPRIYQATFRHGAAYFLLKGQDTQQSGAVSLVAQAGVAEGRAQMLIEPSVPVEPLTPLIGARAIIVDDGHWSMTVVVPFDAYGNPVKEGTLVKVLALHPGNKLEKKLLPVHHLLAWTRIFSRTKAGRCIIVALIGNVHGFEGTMLEVAGWPVDFAVSADPQPLPADGRLLTILRTSILRDKFGNVMPDGTMLTFIVDAPDGTRSYLPAYTIGGIAVIPYQAPRQSGKYIVRATVLGVESRKFTLPFTAGPALGTFPLSTRRDPVNKAVVINAGPLLAGLGQYVPDGTPIRFIITNRSGHSQELDGVSDAGYASVSVSPAQFPTGSYTVVAIAGAGRGTLKFTLP